ncbi:hypothetical protein CTB91_00937 [Dickeya solani]|uniref:Uncharacterized protein n=1 Tax=Dickeya solani D s0432-1 TaxID=1231725 RepID=A0AAV3KAI4_9GAMM|nr:hypothetical protein CTB91_00937 [Dickeya solani]ERO57755.1 hypothetical protein A544_0921 [Dickeya solani D s0432-1]AYQ50945.1 hypothetical protein DSOL99_00943 [Dickeya solani]MBD3604589.1 hypothetical protein [Dickeya solani]NUA38947.1 hypothetical protein [Dickeya solani]
MSDSMLMVQMPCAGSLLLSPHPERTALTPSLFSRLSLATMR